jgi:Cu+-exporting ATPase
MWENNRGTGELVAKDPVCGMFVDEKKTKFKSVYQSRDYFFCSAGCKKIFDKYPEKCLEEKSSSCCRC